jgi:hypothetical protein
MKRKATIFAILLLLAAVIGGIAFGYRAFSDRQLAPAVRAAVVAALDNDTTLADADAYLRAAKLASRTKKDRRVSLLLSVAMGTRRAAYETAASADSESLSSLELTFKGKKQEADDSRKVSDTLAETAKDEQERFQKQLQQLRSELK